MTLRGTKFRLIVLSFAAFVMLGFLALDFYHIRSKNRETMRLLDLADQKAKQEMLAYSIRELQNNAREDLSAFEEIVLSDSEVVTVIEKIEQTGRSMGLDTEITSVEKIDGPTSAGLKSIRIAIESNGSWNSNFNLLRAIESLPNRVMLEETTFSKNDAGWRGSFTFSLYSFD